MVPDTNNALTPEQWRDTSLRQIVRLSLPAHTLRIRVSNVFGTAPLLLSSASVGLARQLGTPDLQAGTVQALHFNGETAVRIPAGGEYLSDPVDMKLGAGADLAVSMHFLGEPSRQTGHPGSRSTSFIVSGDQVMAEQWSASQVVTRWYSLADVEVMAPGKVGAVVAVGDSITDGYGVKPDANTRWTDFLFQRMQREHAPPMGIVNVGIGGGRLLQDGLGPNLVSRFERDVLGRAGVTHAILLIGVNDFGVPIRNNENSPEQRAQLLADIKLGMKQLVERAHSHGICLVGGTMTPYKASDYYHPTDLNEADRQDLNAWIRNSKTFDAVADFDAATRDADHPELFAKSAETLDGLHPGVGGQRLIAEAVPLKALRTCKWNRP